MSHSPHDVMSKEFLEYDLEDAICVLQIGMIDFKAALRIRLFSGVMSFYEADERLRRLRREIQWLKVYRHALGVCPFYTLDDVRSQLRRSLNRLQPVLYFP